MQRLLRLLADPHPVPGHQRDRFINGHAGRRGAGLLGRELRQRAQHVRDSRAEQPTEGGRGADRLAERPDGAVREGPLPAPLTPRRCDAPEDAGRPYWTTGSSVPLTAAWATTAAGGACITGSSWGV